MRVLLSNILILLFCSFSLKADSFFNGVAIIPQIIKFKDSRKSYFTVYNYTENDYIITQRIISENDNASSKSPFIVNPPMRLIKGRSEATMGVIYLNGNHGKMKNMKYHLSVSFIPKVNYDDSHGHLSIPVILSQEIPIVFVDK